jgi:hypothetical protein
MPDGEELPGGQKEPAMLCTVLEQQWRQSRKSQLDRVDQQDLRHLQDRSYRVLPCTTPCHLNHQSRRILRK